MEGCAGLGLLTSNHYCQFIVIQGCRFYDKVALSSLALPRCHIPLLLPLAADIFVFCCEKIIGKGHQDMCTVYCQNILLFSKVMYTDSWFLTSLYDAHNVRRKVLLILNSDVKTIRN